MVWVLVLRKHVTIHQLLIPLLTGATIIDYTGIIKADIGIRDGKIVAIGRGGNQIQWTMWTLLWVLVQKPLLQKV